MRAFPWLHPVLLGGLSFTAALAPAQTPVAPAPLTPETAEAAREQIAAFLRSQPALSPIQRQDALRQFFQAQFPAGVPTASGEAAMNDSLAQQDNATIPASTAQATPAQTADLKARRLLLAAFRLARRTAFAGNPDPTLEQRRAFASQWLQTPAAATLLTVVGQRSQAVVAESVEDMQKYRQALTSAFGPPPPREQPDALLAAPLAQQDAVNAEAAQIMARPDLPDLAQKQAALRTWFEANRARIDAAHAAVNAVLAAEPLPALPPSDLASERNP